MTTIDPRVQAALASVALTLAGGALTSCNAPASPTPAAAAAPTDDKVELTPTQLKAVELGTIAEHAFSPQRTAFGTIDFDEDKQVQVFANYQGRIAQVFAKLGDTVKKDQPLYTVESPDLAQAQSSLIAAAGVAKLNTQTLERDRQLHETQGLSDREFQQATSDQNTALGALEAAKAAVRIFGKTDAEIDETIASRKVDPLLVVRSPLSGRVIARNAQLGLFVQPGVAPAPFAVADVSSLWLLANVAESDVPLFRPGQAVSIKVTALPDRNFEGVIGVLAASLDPNTHTQTIRTEVGDPTHELYPGMLATYAIHTGVDAIAPAIPPEGVVRNGDGSMSIWVTNDDRHFVRQTVVIGQTQDGLDEIKSGAMIGQRVVTRGAVFLSNMANAASSGDG